MAKRICAGMLAAVMAAGCLNGSLVYASVDIRLTRGGIDPNISSVQDVIYEASSEDKNTNNIENADTGKNIETLAESTESGESASSETVESSAVFESSSAEESSAAEVETETASASEIETESSSEYEETETTESILDNAVAINVSGDALIEGVDDSGMAQIGSEVTIEVLNPGEVLAMVSENEKGELVYTAMNLDTANRYHFIAEKQGTFVVTDPDISAYAIDNSESRKAKIQGADGLKLTGLASSSQGYNEIVLNFTAVKNSNDGTNTEDTYYEVKVKLAPPKKSGKSAVVPEGSIVKDAEEKYFYAKKTENLDAQSKKIIVNLSKLTENMACSYEFTVRMVHIRKSTSVPGGALTSPIKTELGGNSITKTFSTKDSLYYEDKLGFTKKASSIFTGQSNVLAGMVKYSKNGSVLHDMMAFAYEAENGALCPSIKCEVKNDNDEVYISAAEYTEPGKYNVVVYASVGDTLLEATEENPEPNSPNSGTMHQANVSFPITVEPGINMISTYGIVDRVAVDGKRDSSFSVVPVGYSGYGDEEWGDYYSQKSKIQKFTYEIKSMNTDGEGYPAGEPIEPFERVKNGISVDKNGKVTIKKDYIVKPTVDMLVPTDCIAVIIKAADFEGNTAEEIVYIRILNTSHKPTEIKLYGRNGKDLGTKFCADEAKYYNFTTYVYADVEVLDQFGNSMNEYVAITPTPPKKNTENQNYVSHSMGSSYATLYIYKPGKCTIKAVATDGEKNSKTLTFNVTAPAIRQTLYGYNPFTSVTYNGSTVRNANFYEGNVTYDAPKGAVVRLYQGLDIDYNNHPYHSGTRRECKGFFGRSWYDWEYEVEGGSLKFEGNWWVITPTEGKTTLNITMKNKSDRGSRGNTSRIVITNTGWNRQYDNAPKITMNPNDRLYANMYSRDGESWGQRIRCSYDSGNFDSIAINAISKNAPGIWINNPDYSARTFDLSIGSSGYKPGTYQYKVSFHNGNSLAAKSATIKVKINKAPQIKILPTYTMNTSLSERRVPLKWTPDPIMPKFEKKVLSANIAGKANDFNKYFEIEETQADELEGRFAHVKFKNTVTAAEIDALKGQTLTGYVKYSYYYAGSKYVKDAVAKVSIKIK